MSDRIMTQHPEGKTGVNIDNNKYEQIKIAILDILKNQKEVSFKELKTRINDLLSISFEGSITWYIVTVKLDLEARGIIERIPRKTPQTLKLSE